MAEAVVRRFCELVKGPGLGSDKKLRKSAFWIHYAYAFSCNQKWEGEAAAMWNSIVTASGMHEWTDYDGCNVALSSISKRRFLVIFDMNSIETHRSIPSLERI